MTGEIIVSCITLGSQLFYVAGEFLGSETADYDRVFGTSRPCAMRKLALHTLGSHKARYTNLHDRETASNTQNGRQGRPHVKGHGEKVPTGDR
jgi:hypothetical protein